MLATWLRPDLAKHNRVDRFEMRGVGGQRKVNGRPADLAVARGTKMVFDVARTVDVLGVGRIPLELREDRSKGLADKIGEHIEPAAMWHSDYELANTKFVAAV